MRKTNYILSKPANNKSICCIVSIIADRSSTDNNVSTMRSLSPH